MTVKTMKTVNFKPVGAYPCGRPETTINLSHLPSGVYFVKLSAETGGWVQKIIKE